MDSPQIVFAEPATLNPVTLLPNRDLELPLHKCHNVLAETTQVPLDLKDTMLLNSELCWSTGYSILVQYWVH